MQVGLEFGERHFYRVQIWAVGRQEQESATGIAHGFGRINILVRGEFVQNDDGSGLQFWCQHLFDVDGEGWAVHCALDDPGCHHRIG